MMARTHAPRRRGSTVVESALVLGMFLLVFFGLFEYCRFLMVLHITNNAARDGARYAVVNLYKPSNFDTVDYTDATGTVYPSVVKYTTARMGSTEKNLNNYKVYVFPVDGDGLAMNPQVIRCATLSTADPKVYPDFKSTTLASDTNYPGWNGANFPNRLAVQISGTFRPIAPLSINTRLLQLSIIPDNIPVTITTVMSSEG